MFQSSHKILREDALTLGLLYHDEMGLTREEIIRLALNGVAWRNQNMSPNTNIRSYDSLNYMIISKFHTNGEHDRILRLISEEPHGIAEIQYIISPKIPRKRKWTIFISTSFVTRRFGFSKNLNIRRDIIRTISSACMKQDRKKDATYKNLCFQQISYGGSEPYIQLLISALKHGLKEIREQSASLLIRQKRHEVLDYVYQNWLKSKESTDQKRACDVLISFRPTGASSKF